MPLCGRDHDDGQAAEEQRGPVQRPWARRVAPPDPQHAPQVQGRRDHSEGRDHRRELPPGHDLGHAEGRQRLASHGAETIAPGQARVVRTPRDALRARTHIPRPRSTPGNASLVGADRASVMRCRRSLLSAAGCCCCCHRCCQPLVLFPISEVSPATWPRPALPRPYYPQVTPRTVHEICEETGAPAAASAGQSGPDCCTAVIYLHTAVHRLWLTSPGVTQMLAVTVVRAPTHCCSAGAHWASRGTHTDRTADGSNVPQSRVRACARSVGTPLHSLQ